MECEWNSRPKVVCPFGRHCRHAITHPPPAAPAAQSAPAQSAQVQSGRVQSGPVRSAPVRSALVAGVVAPISKRKQIFGVAPGWDEMRISALKAVLLGFPAEIIRMVTNYDQVFQGKVLVVIDIGFPCRSFDLSDMSGGIDSASWPFRRCVYVPGVTTFTDLKEMVHDRGQLQPQVNRLEKLCPAVCSINPSEPKPRQHFWESTLSSKAWQSVVVMHGDALAKKHPDVRPLVRAGQCTIAWTGKTFAQQTCYSCLTCGLVDGKGVCVGCIQTCHEGHQIVPDPVDTSGFYCDCGASPTCRAVKQLQPDQNRDDFRRLTDDKKNHKGADLHCPFCHKLQRDYGALEWHCETHHRYHIGLRRYECGWCHHTIPKTEFYTHGMETCVLCRGQFQHFGRNDVGMFHPHKSWGEMERWDGESDRNNLDGAEPAMIVSLRGCYVGTYYSLKPLPSGPVCPTCIDSDERLVHAWSH